MALAKKEAVTVYRLELSKEEAEAVSAVLSRVSGGTHTSRRGLTSEVLRALEKAGVSFDTSDSHGEIHFVVTC